MLKKGKVSAIFLASYYFLLYLNLKRTNIPVMFVLFNDFYDRFRWIDCVYMSFSNEIIILFKYSYF